jgi:hypothetical protein
VCLHWTDKYDHEYAAECWQGMVGRYLMVHTDGLASSNCLFACLYGQVQLCLPITEMDVKLHNLLHLVNKIIASGPLWTTSMFVYEGMWQYLGRWATNKAHPEVTMLRNFADYEYVSWLHFNDPGMFSAGAQICHPILISEPQKAFWFQQELDLTGNIEMKGKETLVDLGKEKDLAMNLLRHYVRCVKCQQLLGGNCVFLLLFCAVFEAMCACGV